MPDAGAPSLLEATIERKVHVRGGETLEIIDGLRFVLWRGEVTCLLGPSGCGKTTALRIVMGLDTVFEGRITPSIESLRLGVVFQGRAAAAVAHGRAERALCRSEAGSLRARRVAR